MTRLRGAETVIVGIQPEVAFAMVQLGMNFEDVHTALDLEEGLAFLQDKLAGDAGWRWRIASASPSSPTPTSSSRGRRRGRWARSSASRASTLRCWPRRSPRWRATSRRTPGGGESTCGCSATAGARGSRWWPSDQGPGIADVELALAGRLHDRQRPRAGASRRTPPRRRVRARHRAGRRNARTDGQVACLSLRGPRRWSAGSPCAPCPASGARATARCSRRIPAARS